MVTLDRDLTVNRITSMIKRLHWAAWMALSFAVVAVLWILRLLFSASPKNPTRLPEVPEALRRKVDRTEQAALEARIRATAEADTAKMILDEAAAIEDGKERRKKLAETLRRL